MKVKLALAAAAIMGAFAISVPSQAAPLSGAGIATEAAKTDAKPMEQVHRRYYRGGTGVAGIGAIAVSGYRRYGYRRYYRPYYGGFYGGGYGYGYPYRWHRRPGIYLGFGF